jgi:hypothetical protein
MQTPLTFFFAFVAVLVLIGAVAWLVRRFAGNRLGGNANRGRMPRLAVIDAAAVDGRRRLVLVRRDNVEHLLMIGGPTDIVVEPNIVRAMPGRDQVSPRPSLGGEMPRGTAFPETGNWPESDNARPDNAPEPALPPLIPTRPARPSFADEMRRSPPPAPEHRHDPLATIAAEPVTRPEPRPDLRGEPPRPTGRNEPQMPRPPLPPLRPSEPPVAKVTPVRGPEPATPAAPVPPPVPQTSSADQNLAEMAKRLEAALRRPAGDRPAGASAPPVTPEPPAVRSAPRVAVNTPTVNVSEPSAAPPVAPPAPKGDFENLEDEMASLLGRPKTPS